MSNISKDPVDLVHQVTAYSGDIWENPFKPAKSIIDQTNNYKRYSHFLANALYLDIDPLQKAYQKLLNRAIETGKLVFECTCFPGPCHLDALRIRLTADLKAKGFEIFSNQVDEFNRNQQDED